MKYYNRRTDAAMMPSTFRWRKADAIHSNRDKDIMRYAPLVMKVVNKYDRQESRVGVFDKHDLIQCGFVGLIEGYDRIIKSKGEVNGNYLEINIKGTIDRYLNYQSTGVAIPEYQIQKFRAEKLAEMIFRSWMFGYRLEDMNSLDKSYASSLGQREHESYLEDSWDTVELRDMLTQVMLKLRAKERLILFLSFGIGMDKMSIKNIANKLEMSEIGVKKAKRVSLSKLNTEDNREFFKHFLNISIPIDENV